MEKEIIIWNINQRNNCGNKNHIPPLVACSLKNKFDIIILTEFYKTSNWIEDLGEKLSKYNVFVSNNNTNQILIATKKDIDVKEVFCWKSSYKENRLDYLAVTIELNMREEILNLTIVGARILVDDYIYKQAESLNAEMKNRKKQCEYFVK